MQYEIMQTDVCVLSYNGCIKIVFMTFWKGIYATDADSDIVLIWLIVVANENNCVKLILLLSYEFVENINEFDLFIIIV